MNPSISSEFVGISKGGNKNVIVAVYPVFLGVIDRRPSRSSFPPSSRDCNQIQPGLSLALYYDGLFLELIVRFIGRN